MDPIDHRRFQFIQTLQTLSERGRAHLLSVEDDNEIADLKRVAIYEQYFEVAVSIGNEAKRRVAEKSVIKA